ncbi:phage major capsid protein, partial [Kingella kingae]|uniref:phage major capsid protein n=1 Tax=Kingella kingae TaxID=504 RepID=UPI0025575673
EKLLTNNADVVAEGTLKPESTLTFEPTSAPVVTIAHWIQATRQILSDAPMLESYISTRLIQGLKPVSYT